MGDPRGATLEAQLLANFLVLKSMRFGPGEAARRLRVLAQD